MAKAAANISDNLIVPARAARRRGNKKKKTHRKRKERRKKRQKDETDTVTIICLDAGPPESNQANHSLHTEIARVSTCILWAPGPALRCCPNVP